MHSGMVFLLIWISTAAASNVAQRSKEAVCLIQGYHSCTQIRNNKTNANDCFRLSRVSANSDNRSVICGPNECPWDGACLKSGVQEENDGFYSVEDLPIAAYYENVHTMTISFPKYLDTTALYVLETRPLSSEIQQAPFRFAGVSNQTTISHRVSNICQRYEFRPTAILSNGSVITFMPKTSNSNPPDFIVDNIRLGSLRFHSERHQVVANLTWKHPYGYTNMDVAKYESYLHTLQCDVPSELLNEATTDAIVKTDEGGYVTATFPEAMVERKCQFRFMVWADSVCGNRTLTDAKIDISLNCSTVEGYRCPVAEMRPVCLSHMGLDPLASAGQAESNISVNVSWIPTAEARPQYYHVRWGPARVLDLRHRGPGAEDDSESSEESKYHAGRQLKPSSRRAKAVVALASDEKSRSQERQRKTRSSPDFSVWILQPETVTQEKVPGDSPYMVLSNLSANTAYGVQICAVFNGDFKRPEWPKVTTNGFSCSCVDPGCTSVKCDQKTISSRLSPVTSATTHLPTIRPPLAVVLRVPQPPDTIESVSDFTQTLVSAESDGIHMRLVWNPPKNLLKEQISGYDVTVETLLPCEQAPACCDYVEFTEIDQAKDNVTGTAELFLPRRVLHSRCEFVAKITTIAINGASSVSLKNIRVPGLPQEQANASCLHLQCSHTCNGTQCLCPPDLILSSDGRTCTSALDRMRNDSPSEDCIARFGCYFNMCDKNGCVCPPGYNMSLDGLSCLTDTPLGAAILQGEPPTTMFDYCQSVGCKYTCTPKGDCLCPTQMRLGPDGKTCEYEDPDLWNNTAPATQPKPAGPSIMCASPGRHLFTWSKDEGVRLTWRSNASAFNAFAPEAEVRVRVGPAVKYSDDVLMIYRLSEDASVASTSLGSETIHLSTPSSSARLGVQFCIYNKHKWNHSEDASHMNWDIVPVILIHGDHSSREEDSDPEDPRGHHNHTWPHEGPPDSDVGFKKTVAIAVVIPISCIIILGSFLALLCYFYPRPMKMCWSRQRSRFTTPSPPIGVERPDGKSRSGMPPDR